ncbi:hypothetical protein [Streptomyces sp. NPDC059009]|uniref:hypothetical protein n=1 Tax=Streptomyces sp. NPDC059009 TaxID=3346694 RepID=UPI0036A3C100
MSSRPHGYARYKLDGCRCYVCAFAVARYNDAREYALRRGQWHPYTDAEPVRRHLRDLQSSGLGLRRIAELAGVDRKRLQVILKGCAERGGHPQRFVRPALAASVLAISVTEGKQALHATVDAVGTHRRLQALVFAGWPQSRLATLLGMSDAGFSAMLRREHVLVRTERAVRDVYNELWCTDPLSRGVSQYAASRARHHARGLGWAPVGAWDDDTIDDPNSLPDSTGMCGTPQGFAAHSRSGTRPCPACRAARAAQRRKGCSRTGARAA